MKSFTCRCGQPVFFENTRCMSCGSTLGFDTGEMRMITLPDTGYKLCENGSEHGVCNWLLPANDPHTLCQSCRMTHVTPNLSMPENLQRWRVLETAKRRLLYSLLQLRLPTAADAVAGHPAMSFQFLEDRGSNPLVAEEYVRTGHATGMITINVAEADDVQRTITRSMMNEAYRTPLGHCRHESGHYYYDRLVQGTGLYDDFTVLFGDATIDYEEALSRYYAAAPATPGVEFISPYAGAHPLEDWAECWAHYLHIRDTLETATASGLLQTLADDFDDWILQWMSMAVKLNELNRSMGLSDAYPFVLTTPVVEKLCFIDSVVVRRPLPS